MKTTRTAMLIPLALAAGVQLGIARAATLTVCASGCEHTTIQGAISHAKDGDTISIGKGHYFESINTLGKGLTLEGINNRQSVIDANGTGTVITIPGVRPVNIANLTITRGFGDGGGISATDGAPVQIDGSIVINNYSTNNGGGINYVSLGSNSGAITISRTMVSDNTTANSGGGVFVAIQQGSARIEQSTLARNAASVSSAGGGVYLEAGQSMQATIDSSSIVDNTEGGGIYASADIKPFPVNVTNSTIAGNAATGSNVGGVSYFCADMTLDHDVIAHNTGINGAGINGVGGSECRRFFASTSIRSTYVLDNVAAGSGGGTYILGPVANGGDVVIRDNMPDNCAKGTVCP